MWRQNSAAVEKSPPSTGWGYSQDDIKVAQ